MHRRHFLQTMAWVSGGLLIARCTPVRPQQSQKIRGIVTSRGSALANVVVSDGYSVVATDSKGKFEFNRHPDAVAVFVSTPSGYAFNNENGIARHYHLVPNTGTSADFNFELQPLGRSDNEHQFIIWADPQVRNKSDVAKLMQETVPDVQQFVTDAGAQALLHGITVGDIAWDDLTYFNDYNAAVAQMNIPFFQCLGNHDMDFKGDDAASDNTFQQTYGPTCYSFNRGQVHYVVMDDVRYLGTDRNYDGYIQPHHLEWLRKDLSFVSNDKLIVLCVHIPVHSGVKNNTDLYNILEGRQVHIMSGHTHYHVNNIRENIYEHNHGTVCGAWWTGPICGDGTPGGYGVYSVKGNQLSWQYKSTGFALAHQIKIHDALPEGGLKNVVVNIWNYDPAWKNEYWIDGVSKGTLEEYEGYDPEAYKTMLGPSLPNPRGFAEPVKTKHLFKAMVPATAREMRVSATDRFGKIYTEKINFS